MPEIRPSADLRNNYAVELCAHIDEGLADAKAGTTRPFYVAMTDARKHLGYAPRNWENIL